MKAANKAFDYFKSKQQPQASYFFVKAENKLEKIIFSDIWFAEAMENYVAIYMQDRKIITHATLKMIQEILPAKHFIQPHKSYLVNMNAIKAIEGNMLHVQNYEVPISKYQKEEVMEKIINNKLLKR